MVRNIEGEITDKKVQEWIANIDEGDIGEVRSDLVSMLGYEDEYEVKLRIDSVNGRISIYEVFDGEMSHPMTSNRLPRWARSELDEVRSALADSIDVYDDGDIANVKLSKEDTPEVETLREGISY